jgi:broad specificity phosphatase PhoE
MKTIYYVRHGETDGNLGSIQMGENAQLNATGIAQVQGLANQLKDVVFDSAMSSTYDRAIDTAKILLKGSKAKLSKHKELIERRRPSEVMGKPKNDSKAIKIKEEIDKKFAVPRYRYSDEDNFDDLNKRSEKVIKIFNKTEGENILCVGHGFFARVIIAKMLFEDSLTPKICKEFIRTMHLENTGVCEFRQSANGQWFLWRWNDISHLK